MKNSKPAIRITLVIFMLSIIMPVSSKAQEHTQTESQNT